MKQFKNTTLLILILAAFGCQQDKLGTINEKILSVQKEYAPDKREALFDITAKSQNGAIILIGETNLPEAKKQLLKELQLETIIDRIEVLPAGNQKKWGLTILPVSNLRGEPRYSAELVSQALAGTPVKILKQKGSWSLVQTPDKYISWVLNSSLRPMNKQEFKNWKGSQRVFVNVDTTPIYNQADKNASIISTMQRGSLFVQKGEESSFLEIELPSGELAYIEKEHVITFEDWSERTEISQTEMEVLGKSLLGRSYLWGGTSPAALDCSGFIKTLHWSQGLILARDASLQVRHGEIISLEGNLKDLIPGDLLYFGTPANENKPERITHVGFYLGNMAYIHAAGMVKINSFDPEAENFNKNRRNSLLQVRRIKNSIDTDGIQSVKNHPWYN